ncbi:MAG: HAD family hydrolase [Oscillospiraceae bacterium]
MMRQDSEGRMKTLYVTDLDGTLLKSDEMISEFSLQVINKLTASGTLFSYATARSLSSAVVVTKGLELNVPVVIYNGVFLVNPKTGEQMAENTFCADEMKEVVQFLTEQEISPLVYSFVNGEEKVSWLAGSENEGMRHYLSNRRGDRRLREISDRKELYAGEVFYFTCIGTKERLAPVYARFRNDPHYNVIFQQELYRNEFWCEMMPKNATKANALLQLKKILGCDRLVTFGDRINDLPMFEISDECYAVENAVSELKEKATGIIRSNDADGVARWMEAEVRRQ